MSGKVRIKLPRIITDAISRITEDKSFNVDYRMVLDNLHLTPDQIDKDRLRDDLSEITHDVVSNMLVELFEDLTTLMLETRLEKSTISISWREVTKGDKIWGRTCDVDASYLQAALEEIEEMSAKYEGQYLTHYSNILGTLGGACREIFYLSFMEEVDNDRDYRSAVADLGNHLLDCGAVSFDYETLVETIMCRPTNTNRSIELRYYEVDDFALTHEYVVDRHHDWIDTNHDMVVDWGTVEIALNQAKNGTGNVFVLVNDIDIFVGQNIDDILGLSDVQSISIMEAN